MEEPAHVRVVHAGCGGDMHHVDVPEMLRGVDYGVASGDRLFHARLVASVHEHGTGFALALSTATARARASSKSPTTMCSTLSLMPSSLTDQRPWRRRR